MSYITTTIDGVKVEGEITHRSPKEITVSITSPYSGLSDSSYIPTRGWGSIPYSQGKYPERDYTLEYGDKEAVVILERLYFVFKTIETEKTELKKKIEAIDFAKKCFDERNDAFHDLRKHLRIQVKSGEIDNKIYQKHITQMKKMLREYKHTCFDKEYEFRKCFPMRTTEKTLDKVLEIVRNQDPLPPVFSSRFVLRTL